MSKHQQYVQPRPYSPPNPPPDAEYFERIRDAIELLRDAEKRMSYRPGGLPPRLNRKRRQAVTSIASVRLRVETYLSAFEGIAQRVERGVRAVVPMLLLALALACRGPDGIAPAAAPLSPSCKPLAGEMFHAVATKKAWAADANCDAMPQTKSADMWFDNSDIFQPGPASGYTCDTIQNDCGVAITCRGGSPEITALYQMTIGNSGYSFSGTLTLGASGSGPVCPWIRYTLTGSR